MSDLPRDALQAIAARCSTRSFSERPLAKATIETIIDAGRLAPTANNVQPWEFIVVTDAGTRRRIADMTDWGKFISQAPVCVAVFCKDVKQYLEDGSAATQTILIAAASLGVQSCWVAGDKKPYAAAVGEMLGVPPGCKLVSLIPLGYAREPASGRAAKRDLSSVLHWEKF